MVNRIENWWNEVKRWQARFEKIAPGAFDNSRIFKKEKLKQYDQLLSRTALGLTKEERLTKQALRIQQKSLEKELYPNRYVRLFRNLFQLASIVVERFSEKKHIKKQLSAANQELDKFGLPEVKGKVGKAIQDGKSDLHVPLSESYSEREMLDYKIHITNDADHSSRINGYTASLSNGKTTVSMLVENDASVDKEQVRNLLNGRPVNFDGNIWRVPDLNDRDAEGNIRLKDVVVADYSVERELAKLPVAAMETISKSELINGLKSGKQQEVTLNIDGVDKLITLEANPLKRTLNLYEDGRKVTIDKLKERTGQNAKVLPMVQPKKVVSRKSSMKVK